ncbi:MAG TPA: DUF2845 domain-containing protein [Spirochaetota bacterium]|jgi:hypothetical protein|uniref:Lipoprotein n=1 Tax=Candidatus Methanofastidiosum methylothiophilum TaxID=1705564 RepID=A0A150JFW5_9EURY|nr:MAG: hypothetical protein APG09_01488 [Candidatus Methanofastidiosum methylthiophilus]HOA06286.1 DUF2845 domain-containing protein [Spirochaetota bacterium]HOH35999.1 DUF2845 domain-containing protein [Spirochaetota bacterium]HPJ13532.1 DUF2845 domain-containing protein [Spirochaetota bacterium]HPM33243.1 DUF2845 domain-containing protein [Spirochaetota bacterium]
MIQFLIKGLLSVITVGFLFSCAETDKFLIVPNKGVGDFKIHKSNIVNKEKYDPDEIHCQYEKGKLLKAVLVYSNKYYTDKKIRVGMNKEEVLVKCGKPLQTRKMDIKSGDYILSAYGTALIYEGIAYIYDKNDVIISIFVFSEPLKK